MSHAAALDRPQSDAATLATWAFAVALATLGTAVLWKAEIGINWGVCTTCTVIAFFATLRDRYGSVNAPSLAAGAWAVVLAFGTAITADGFHIGILVLATLVLLAIALVTAGDVALGVLRPLVALQAPFVALRMVIAGLGAEASGSARAARSPGAMTLLRTTLVTGPLVVLLVLLLAEADPIFAAARDAVSHVVPDDFIGRTLFFLVLFGITLGAYGTAQRGRLDVHAIAQPAGLSLGPLERRVLLSSLATIMWLFVGSAAVSLQKNPAAVAGSGVTYAEYVHRGFAELSVAATLVIGATLLTRRSWLAADVWARRVAIAAIAGECGMIGIAFMRVVRYEQAYGFTTLRLYAEAYMVVLAFMSGLLLVEIARRTQSTRFAYYSVSAALTILAACVYLNIDAWIVRQNIDRYAATGSLDTTYLMYDLSGDAIPAIVESVPRLHEPDRTRVIKFLREKDESRNQNRRDQWYEWNYRARRSAAAMRTFRGNDISVGNTIPAFLQGAY